MESIHQAIVGNIPLLGQAGKQLRFSIDRLALHQAIVNIQGYVVIDGGLLHIQGVRILRHNDVQPLDVAVAGRWGIVVAAARRQSKQACCTDQKRNDFLHLYSTTVIATLPQNSTLFCINFSTLARNNLFINIQNHFIKTKISNYIFFQFDISQ